jgi:hypothetical protein
LDFSASTVLGSSDVTSPHYPDQELVRRKSFAGSTNLYVMKLKTKSMLWVICWATTLQDSKAMTLTLNWTRFGGEYSALQKESAICQQHSHIVFHYYNKDALEPNLHRSA